MKKEGVVSIIILGLVAYWLWSRYRGNTGHIMGTLTDEQQHFLCDSAPLNSFGEACVGYSWVDDPALGPVELRSRVITFPGMNAYVPRSALGGN